jgi:hypothetical protein
MKKLFGGIDSPKNYKGVYSSFQFRGWILSKMKRPFGIIDFPENNQIVDRFFHVRGWVLSWSKKPFNLQITIDGLIVPSQLRRIKRLDVSKRHPKLASTNPLPGFVATIDVQSIPPGDHILSCVVVRGTKKTVIHSVNITKTNPIDLENNAQKLSGKDKALRRTIPESNRLLLMHIPKTAGTTLNEIIRAQFPKDKSLLHAEITILGKRPDEIEDLEKYNYISAHLRYDTINRHINIKRFFVITMLRNPIKQTISHLGWVARLAEPEFSREFNRLPDYIKLIVDRISSVDIVKFIDTLNPKERNLFDNCQTRYFLPINGNVEISSTQICDALRKLNLVDAIGLTERFSESLFVIAFYMGWKSLQSKSKHNVSKQRFLIDYQNADTEVKMRLWQLTRFDCLLYNQAQVMFEKQLRNILTIIRTEYPDKKLGFFEENLFDVKILSSLLELRAGRFPNKSL